MIVLIITIYLAILSLLSTYAQGSRFYNFKSQRCCDGQIHELPEGHNFRDYTCCGTELYEFQQDNESAEFLPPTCCLNQLHSRMNRSERCCGAERYESSTSVCYQWGRSEWGEDEEYEVLRFSADDIRNNQKSVCGKPKDKKTFYDPKKQTCCSGILYEWKDELSCCGEDYIDTTIGTCCYEVYKDKKTKRDKVMTSVIFYNDDISKIPSCCNGSVIDFATQMCCGGVAVTLDLPKIKELGYYPRCCGTQLLYDMKSQMCVDEKTIVNRVGEKQVYCGEHLHNISGDEPLNVYCFNGTLLKLKGSERLCPVNETQVSYEIKEQVCGFDEVVDITPDDLDNNRTFYCWKTNERKMIFSKTLVPVVLYRPLSNDSEDYYY